MSKFDINKLLNIDPDEAKKLAAEEKDNGKRSPSARLLPPVQLGSGTPPPNPYKAEVPHIAKSGPVAAQLAISRLMSDEFMKAVTRAGMKVGTTAEFVKALRLFLITGKMP